MSNRILLVEDDVALGQQVIDSLREAGFEPHWVQDGDDARSLRPDDYRLIVLDLMLPGTYGMDLLKRYRAKSEVPVLILSARDDTADKIRGLQLGADDYVTKPFFPEELLARIQACLRRPNLSGNERLVVGAIVIDLERREVTASGNALSLTPVELEILTALARRKGAAVTRDALVEAALDPAQDSSRRTLDVHISRLRTKLGEDAKQLETVWGIGYRLSEGS
ncbi:MAG: response regulator transcription factor [Myxococcales bacterium]|nr:MAG: response regulator transcription factor [Myxococcales bacterium]